MLNKLVVMDKIGDMTASQIVLGLIFNVFFLVVAVVLLYLGVSFVFVGGGFITIIAIVMATRLSYMSLRDSKRHLTLIKSTKRCVLLGQEPKKGIGNKT